MKLKYLVNLFCKPKCYAFLTILLLLLLVLPDFLPLPYGPYAFQKHANGFRMIDMLIHYSPDEAYRLIAGYGEAGRSYYIAQSLTLDLLIPFSLMLFFCASFMKMFKQTYMSKFIKWFMLIAAAGFVCDYAENACVITMIVNYPARLNAAAVFCNIFSLAKDVFCTFNLLVFLFGMIFLCGRCLKKANIRRHNSNEKEGRQNESL